LRWMIHEARSGFAIVEFVLRIGYFLLLVGYLAFYFFFLSLSKCPPTLSSVHLRCAKSHASKSSCYSSFMSFLSVVCLIMQLY
jgi:hypothetical protein